MDSIKKKFNFRTGAFEGDIRKWTRFPPDPGCSEITLQGDSSKPRQGTILDECVEGISIEFTDVSDLSIGQNVSIQYYGAAMPGVINQLTLTENATWRVGIEWADNRHVSL